jgi:multiple sugar transport system permease protein
MTSATTAQTNAALSLRARSRRAREALQGLGLAIRYVILLALSILFTLPFVFMISTALKTSEQMYRVPVSMIPNPMMFNNFPDALGSIPFLMFAKNTLTITGINLIGETLMSAVVAFGFARMRFVGREFWFTVVLATMMLPQQVTLIPLFILYKQIGWLDTFLPLIVPPVLGGVPFYIFLLRQFFMGIPRDFVDAARIDGANSLQVLLRIFLPMSTPAIASVGIFSFMFNWNDFFLPLIFLSSTENKTQALGLALFRGEFQNTWNWMMAGSVMVLTPCVVVFFLAQRYFIEGISLGGLKG